jgi:hypothetical protein
MTRRQLQRLRRAARRLERAELEVTLLELKLDTARWERKIRALELDAVLNGLVVEERDG